MPMSAEEIKRLIRINIPHAQVELHDVRGDQDHYSVTIVSKAFAGKSRVQRHLMVYAVLGDKMGDQLHALSLRTLTPEEERST